MFTTSHAALERVTLHYGALGPADGPKVLFLHGWPDLWFTWEGQMVELARLAMARPELVRSLTVVNAPHPLVFAKALLLRPSQLLRSWYMFLFQIPGLAESLLSLCDAAVLGWLLRHGARLDSAELTRYREQWRSARAARALLYWYRALHARVQNFDTGHWPFREEPQRFAAILGDWLHEQRTPRALSSEGRNLA